MRIRKAWRTRQRWHIAGVPSSVVLYATKCNGRGRAESGGDAGVSVLGAATGLTDCRRLLASSRSTGCDGVADHHRTFADLDARWRG